MEDSILPSPEEGQPQVGAGWRGGLALDRAPHLRTCPTRAPAHQAVRDASEGEECDWVSQHLATLLGDVQAKLQARARSLRAGGARTHRECRCTHPRLPCLLAWPQEDLLPRSTAIFQGVQAMAHDVQQVDAHSGACAGSRPAEPRALPLGIHPSCNCPPVPPPNTHPPPERIEAELEAEQERLKALLAAFSQGIAAALPALG